MKTSVTTGLKLTYVNPSTGETEEIYAEKTVPIENYSDEWYQQRDVNRVLNLVSSTYRGNYTTSYASKTTTRPTRRRPGSTPRAIRAIRTIWSGSTARISTLTSLPAPRAVGS